MLRLTTTSNPVNVISVNISERPPFTRQAGLRHTPLAVPVHVAIARIVACVHMVIV